jgi:hypothetical protein
MTIADFINDNPDSILRLHMCQNPKFQIRLTIDKCRVVNKVEAAEPLTNHPGVPCGWVEQLPKTLTRWICDERLDPVAQQWVLIPEDC